GAVRPSADVRPGRARANRSLPGRARSAHRHRVRPPPAVRGQRDPYRRRDLVLSGPRGADGPDDVPALLREAEDGRRRPPDLRRRLAARGRALRSALPQEPAALAADGGLRHRAPGQSSQGEAAGSARGDASRARPAQPEDREARGAQRPPGGDGRGGALPQLNASRRAALSDAGRVDPASRPPPAASPPRRSKTPARRESRASPTRTPAWPAPGRSHRRPATRAAPARARDRAPDAPGRGASRWPAAARRPGARAAA